MAGQTEFTLKLGSIQPGKTIRRAPDSAMRILILGDFSGRGKTTANEKLSEQSILQVDIDNFSAVMSRIAPELHLQPVDSLAAQMNIGFQNIDDFHPDSLSQRVEIFQQFLQLRKQLMDPASFEQAAGQLRQNIKVSEDESANSINDVPDYAQEDDAATLDRLLGESSRQQIPAAKTGQNLASRYISEIIAEYIVPDTPPYRDLYIQAVDQALGAQMRELLHHPDFQALEAAWRCLYMLVTELETDETLSLHVLDINKQKLFTELDSAEQDLRSSSLYRLLMEQGAENYGGEPWSMLVGNYTFTTDSEDLGLLGKLGILASHAGGPFLGAADPRLLACNSLAESPDPNDWPVLEQQAAQQWQALRRNPAAAWIGLALPRLLMRLPYGADTDPIDSFEFEEMPAKQQHEAFLWGNPAFHCALLLARSFTQQGWSMQPGDDLQLDDQPAYIMQQHGESRLHACAEVFLSETAMEKILLQGVMPFISHRNRNIARLARFQSIAEPLKALSGSWSQDN